MAKQDVELQFKLIDGVTKSLGAIQKGVTGLGASIVAVNQAADLTKTAFSAIAGVAGVIGGAISSAASVEDALVRVSDITKATTEEQAALQQAIRSAVETTRFSAEEAAGALVLLSEDGFSASQAVDELGRVLAFAQANALSAADAANALGGVLDTYGEKPQIIGELADKLTAVSRAAGVSTKALQDGLIAIGVTAEQANIPLDDAIGYLGLLAANGLEGSKGVKSLTTVLRDIQDPASKAGKALNDLGLEGADFATILARVGNDSSAAEKLLLAFTGKSRDALKALLTQGGGDLGKFAEVIAGAAGESQRAADVLNKTFNGALAQITNQLAQTRNELLNPILAPLTEEFRALSERLSAFAKTDDFQKIVDNFTVIARDGIKAAGDLIQGFDFSEAVKKTVEFSTAFASSMQAIVKTINATAKLIGGFSNLVSATFSSLVVGTSEAAAALIAPLALFDEGAQGIFESLKSVSADAQLDVETSLAAIGNTFGVASEDAAGLTASADTLAVSLTGATTAADGLASSVAGIGKQAAFSGPTLDAFGLDLQRIGLNSKLAADGIKEAGKAVEISAGDYKKLQDELGKSVSELERVRAAYKKAFESGASNVDEAWAAVQRVGSAVADLRGQLDSVKIAAADVELAFKGLGLESQKSLEDAAKKGAESFQLIIEAAKNGQATQEDVARAFEAYAKRLAQTAVDSDDATKRQIAAQIELAGSVAGVSRELIDAGTAGLRAGEQIRESGEKASESWTDVRDAVRETNTELRDTGAAVADAAAQIADGAGRAASRVNETILNTTILNDQWRETARLFGADVLTFDRLAQNAEFANERFLNGLLLRRKGIEEESAAVEKLIEKEKELSEVRAGTFGVSAPASPATAAAAGNRSGAGTSARGEAAPISITINQNGATPETIRELTPLIERELSRLGALRR